MFIRRSKKGRYFRYDDSLLPLIDFQQLSKLQNILSFFPKIQKHQQIHNSSKFTKPLRIIFECGLNSFFPSKIAGYFRVRIIIECGLFSS